MTFYLFRYVAITGNNPIVPPIPDKRQRVCDVYQDFRLSKSFDQ